MTKRRLGLWCTLLAGSFATASCDSASMSPSKPPAAQPAPSITAQMFKSHEVVRPGRRFTLGIELTIPEGWHIYWAHPGASGLATSVQLQLPDGCRAGPVQFPLPKTFDQGQGQVGFGYEKSVMLMVDVTASPSMNIGDHLTWSAEVAWLACREACIPGQTKLSGEIEIGYTTVSSDAARLEPWHRQRPLGSLDANNLIQQTSTQFLDDGRRWEVGIDWKSPVDQVQIFPMAPDSMAFLTIDLKHKGNHTLLRYAPQFLKHGALKSPLIRSLVTYHAANGQRRGGWVHLPVLVDDDGPVPPSPFD